MGRRVLALGILATFVVALTAAAQQDAVMDRVVAVVDDDPILASEMELVLGLGLVQEEEGETEEMLRRRVLDLLIDQKLRFHEIDRFRFVELPLDEVEEQFEHIEASFPSQAEFQSTLQDLGMTEDDLRQLIGRQLMVLIFVEERLGPRVFVDLSDIDAYYSDVLRPRLEAISQPVPPIKELREDIRTVLRELRLNEEIDTWTDELRVEADIFDYLDSDHDELPPTIAASTEPGEGE